MQQGWKDSHDSVFHADGTLAEAPIALCEVQGYVYARLAGARPSWRARSAHGARGASSCARRREALRQRFESAFWCEELGTYALALDGAQAALPGAHVERRPLRCSTGIARPRARAPRSPTR